MARFVLALTTMLAIATSAQARALSAAEVEDSLMYATDRSKDLQPLATSIDRRSVLDYPEGKGPLFQTGRGLKDAVPYIDIYALEDAPPFGKNESTSVRASFQSFVKEHQTLLEILADKGALLEPDWLQIVRQHMALALKRNQLVLNDLGPELTRVCESQAEQMKKMQTELNATLTKAIDSYPHDKLGVPATADSVEASSAAQLVESTLKQLTAYSQDLQPVAASITIVNGPLIVIGQGPYPKIIQGFTQIVTATSNFLAAFEGASPFDKDESTSIRAAFQTFVTVHQSLLAILTGKGALFTAQPFIGQPVAAVLRQDENVLDALGFKLIEVCESQAEQMEKLQTSLDITLTNAVNTYAPDGLVNII